MKRLSILSIYLTLTMPLNMLAQEVLTMLSSRWGQTTPFRQSCPADKNGDLTPPGCGAVALGQIVNYYRATDHGFGHIKYDYTQGGVVQGNIDVDFAQCRFDWDNIIDAYIANQYTAQQSKAVSDFLFWMGAAIRMHYRTEGSAPSNNGCTMWGIHHFLHFSNKAVLRSRVNYSTAEWIEMLNNNLQAHHPVYYAGRWRNGSQVSEHIFVVDGLDNQGRYSVNFGVGNSVQNREGIEINVLNQWGDGTLGGRGVCYNIGQDMMTDIYPSLDDEYIDDGLIITRPLVLNDNPDKRDAVIALGEIFSLSWRFQHYGIERSYIEYALCLSDDNGNVVNKLQATDGKYVGLGPGYYLDLTKHFKLPSNLNDGKYKLQFVSRPQDAKSDEWQTVYETLPAKVEISVRQGQAHLTVPVNHRRSPKLSLREEIRVVDNVYESQQAGTALLLAMRNTSISAFCDTLRLYITIEGESVPFMYETEAAVYDGCDADYHILIPDADLYLKGKNFTVRCEYKDQALGSFVPLTTTDIHAGVIHEASSDELNTLTIFDINGRQRATLVANEIEWKYPLLLRSLPNGVYIVVQNKESRKVVIQK